VVHEKVRNSLIGRYPQQKLNNPLLIYVLVNTIFDIQTKTLMKSFSQLSN